MDWKERLNSKYEDGLYRSNGEMNYYMVLDEVATFIASERKAVVAEALEMMRYIVEEELLDSMYCFDMTFWGDFRSVVKRKEQEILAKFD